MNEGEIPQYYVDNDHEAIIDKKTFDLVQVEMDNRKGRHYSGNDIFSDRIVCGECGGYFGRKVWHSNDKYKSIIYRCNKKYEKGKVCTSGYIKEEEIKKAFIEAYNKLDRKEIIKNAEIIKNKLLDITKENKEKEKLTKEQQKIVNEVNKLIELNASKPQNQKKYLEQYNELEAKGNDIQIKLDKVDEKIHSKEDREKVIDGYINNLKASKKNIEEFDEGLWCSLVDKIIVNKDSMYVVWKDGSKIEVLK